MRLQCCVLYLSIEILTLWILSVKLLFVIVANEVGDNCRENKVLIKKKWCKKLMEIGFLD